MWYHLSHMETNQQNSKFLPAAVVVAGLLIAGAVYWNGQNPAPAAPAAGGQPTAPKVDIKDVNIAGAPFIGQTNAPVTIAVWGDFQCVFCKKFEQETLPQMVRDYVDTGKVKIVFMDFAFQGEDSVTAAVYGRSVWKLYPTQYFSWRVAIYTAQDEGGSQGFGDAASIDKLNGTIPGVDAAKVAADVKANEIAYKAMVQVDNDEAQKVGVNATPAVLIGTQVILGAYPYPTFQTAIDQLLK